MSKNGVSVCGNLPLCFRIHQISWPCASVGKSACTCNLLRPLSRVVLGLNFQRGVLISPRLVTWERVPWVERLFLKPSSVLSGVNHMSRPSWTSGGNCLVERQWANGSSSVAMQLSGSSNGKPPPLAATKLKIACISVLDFAPYFSQE